MKPSKHPPGLTLGGLIAVIVIIAALVAGYVFLWPAIAPQSGPKCEHCGGTGYIQEYCPRCKGSGKNRSTGAPCSMCGGKGQPACTVCGGTGVPGKAEKKDQPTP